MVAEIAEVPDAAGEPQPRILFIDSINGNEVVVFGQQQVYLTAGGLIDAATEAGFTEGRRRGGPEAGASQRRTAVVEHRGRLCLD